jgi:protocatechuate 3,4-dioxygenase alpha subunit
MSEGSRLIASPSQTIGPFFHFAIGTNQALGCLAPAGTPGERIWIEVHVFDGAGAAVPDALVELWQADADGRYVRAGASPIDSGSCFSGFGRLATDSDGICVFETIRPGPVPAGDAPQAGHINICLFARGLLRQVYTRLYFAGDPALDEDPVLGCIPAERRRTLLAASAGGQRWSFDIRLQGEGETVFFDI